METPIEQRIAAGIAERIARGIAIAIAAIIAMTIFVFLGGKVVQWLWNWLLPPLFGFPTVTYWQALGFLALSRILFGSLGMGGGHRGPRSRGFTREEKERFRQRIRDRCEMGPTAPEAPPPAASGPAAP
jgi:hypothetical protein